MKYFEQQLDPQKFGRVHRGTIVNFDRVKEFRALPRGDYILILNDGTQLKVSRSHQEKLGKIVALTCGVGSPPLKYRGNGKRSDPQNKKLTR